MKVYRIKHKPSGKYITNARYRTTSKYGMIFVKSTPYIKDYIDNPDYEIIYDEIKD